MTAETCPPRLVVYTAYYGGKEPLNGDVFGGFTSCDRVVFTDRSDVTLEGARVIIDPLDGLDAARASRRAKLAPHRFLSDYDWSLYIDNNAKLLMDPLEVFARFRSYGDASFYAFRHPSRDCVYEEARTVMALGKDDRATVKARMRDYQSNGVPEHIGMIHGNFLLRRHMEAALQTFGDRWYEHVLAYSRRDQLSFPVLRDALGLDIYEVTEIPADTVRQANFYQRHLRREDFSPSLPEKLKKLSRRAGVRLRRVLGAG